MKGTDYCTVAKGQHQWPSLAQSTYMLIIYAYSVAVANGDGHISDESQTPLNGVAE